MSDIRKPTIVVLGGGFGGAYCAQALEKALPADAAEIVLIDRNNFFVFYPLLVEAGTGSLEPRHAVISTRTFVKRTTFRMAEATGVDLERRIALYRLEGRGEAYSVEYDHLVIALGSVTNTPNIPGLREYGFELKSLTDAVSLRDRAIRLLEAADATPDPAERHALLHVVVVGANFTGVETAGEYDAFLKEASRLYKNVSPSDCRVTLIEISDRILAAVDDDLSDYAAEQLRRRGTDVRLRSTVDLIGADRVTLSTGESLPTRTVVWCAGIAPNPLVASLGLPVDSRGYISCENDLRVKGFDNVWAIGDCAVNVDPSGEAYPATAQHAVGQARHASKNIARVLRGQAALPCNLSTQGTLAPLGCRTAVAKVFGIKLSGFLAWFVWRSVYLLEMPGWARRMRVALDWTMDLLFRRDYVQLGVHRTRAAESTSRNGNEGR